MSVKTLSKQKFSTKIRQRNSVKHKISTSNIGSSTGTTMFIPIRYIIVAGGGGAGGQGGPSTPRSGGGGGGGGVLRDTNFNFTRRLQYNVTVGIGGSAGPVGFPGTNGTNSSIICDQFPDTINLVAIGGGKGGGANADPVAGNGGSGGGGGGIGLGAGLGTPGQGYNGSDGGNSSTGTGGGGGGAGGPGFNQYGSGAGLALFDDITGTSYGYSRGGNISFSQPPTNYGQGGNSGNATDGAFGGFQGVVIIRYTNAYPFATVTGAVTQTYVGSDILYIFTGAGTITFN
jgi:hypothetical protein